GAPEMPAPPAGDTQFMVPQGMPMQPTFGYPQMGYPQAMPYGYPPYPGMYPQQMGYPPMPGMYPPQAPQQQAPEPERPASDVPDVRLPDPGETGVKPPAPPVQGNGGTETKSKEAQAKEDAPVKAGDIIQQYLRR